MTRKKAPKSEMDRVLMVMLMNPVIKFPYCINSSSLPIEMQIMG